MHPDDFVYPPYELPLAEAFEGRFESAFIILHPFVRVPESLAWKATRRYPEDAQIAAFGNKVPWSEIAAGIDLHSLAGLNQALLSLTGSLPDSMADPAACHRLRHFLEQQPVRMPVEGRFEPLLQNDLLQIFAAAGFEELIFVPEFPQSDPASPFAIDALRSGSIPFPTCGTLLAPDASFLLTVDWDSFFTLFYGTRSFITDSVRRLHLEGFFANANTNHAWWNYSLGCATVTISPEDWQPALSQLT